MGPPRPKPQTARKVLRLWARGQTSRLRNKLPTRRKLLAASPKATQDFACVVGLPVRDGIGDKTSFVSLIGQPFFTPVPPKAILSGATRGLFVVPMQGSDEEVSRLLDWIPETWLEAVRRSDAALLFDHSREGTNYSDERSFAWHQACQDKGLDPRQLLYVTQNRSTPLRYAKWRSQNRIAEGLTVLNDDYFIRRFFLHSWGAADQFFHARKTAFLRRDRLDKRFLSLNYKPRSWRIAFLTRLLKDALWEEGFVSFGGFESESLTVRESDHVWRAGGPISQFLDLSISPETKDYLPALIDKGQVFFDSGRKDEQQKTMRRTLDMHSDIFARSAFSAVTETEMTNYRKRITEKPFKALANAHPFVLFGNFDSLAFIRALGFETFQPWIDESYDCIAEPERRFRSAYQSFVAFQDKAGALLLNDGRLRDLVLFNLEHSFFGVKERYRRQIDTKLHRAILESLPLLHQT